MELRDQLQAALGTAYSLERELGGGGMSRVFLANETALDRAVVVKVLSPELGASVNVDRFRREIQLAARLQQAQIVPLLSAGELGGVLYYTMPFVEGESLRARLAREGALPIPDVIGILRDITRALAYAHQHGIVHRDIKPDNVLLSGGTAVVTDFGIAKALAAAATGSSRSDDASDAAITQLGTSVGTPAYISPEQAAGDPQIDARSDIYSLGCMAYELLTGRAPFAGRSPQKTLVAHLTEKPQPVAELRPDTPTPLAELVMRCMEKEPARRPQSASEIAAALDAATTTTSGVLPAAFLSGPGASWRGLAVYAGVSAVVALFAKAAVVALGVPDWVFGGALLLIGVGFALAVVTAFGGVKRLTWAWTFRAFGSGVSVFAFVVVAVMILRLFGIGPVASLLAAGRLHGREPLLVVDFNAGKDSSLSHVVTEAVRTNLGQSKVVSIMPPTAIAAALQRMQRPPTTIVDATLAREIALREGVKAIVSGDVTPLGSGYVVAIRLVSADSGSELAAYRTTIKGPDQLLDAIDGLTRKLRGRIGESLKSVHDAPALDQVTTSSLDALRKYAEGTRAADLSADYTRAAQLLREAVAKDSMFGMAYRKLGVALNNSGMPRPQIDSALSRAYALRDRLPEKEKYLAIATYYQTGPGNDRQKGIEGWQQALAVDSTDITARVNLGNAYRQRRQFDKAEAFYAGVAASPGAPSLAFSNYAGVLLQDGKIAQSESVYSELARHYPAVMAGQTYPGLFLYVRGQIDSSEAFWQRRANDPNPANKANALSNLVPLAVLRGRLRQAATLSRETRALNASRGIPANPLADSLDAASIEIWFREETAKGIHALDAALAQVPLRTLRFDQRPYVQFANMYSMAGRPEKARALLAEFDAEVQNPAERRSFEPARHGALAEIALAEKRPLDAVREYWKSDSLPDGPSSSCTHCIDSDLGRAYDLANMPDSAIAHWERFISDSSIRAPGRDGALVPGIHKRLGELYEAKGDLQHAATHYSAFLELWKNADPELQSKVADVKRRLAAIQAREKR